MYSRTAIHFAVDGGNCDIIEFLINQGADINIVDKSVLQVINLGHYCMLLLKLVNWM